MYAPNSNGIIGDTVRAASPQLAYRIGQEFKAQDQEGSAQHLLAHAILGAAVSYATGNNITTGALSGATSEAVAPALSDFLFNTKDPKELTQEQKDTITSIITLGTASIAYGAMGDISVAVNASEVGKGAVEWNGFNINKKESESLRAKKDQYWRVADGIVKDTSVEVEAAAGLGFSGAVTYVGDGKVNFSGAVVTGWSAGASANKSFTQGEKADGLYTESCISGKYVAGVTACFGASENKKLYTTEKIGVGIEGQFGTATGYSKTYQIFPTSRKRKAN